MTAYLLIAVVVICSLSARTINAQNVVPHSESVSTSTPASGCMFFDQGASGGTNTKLCASTAAGWATAFGLAVPSNVQKNAVLDCGAVGDDTTDDTAALQNCINSLPVTGGTIVFPQGYTFKVTGSGLSIGNGSSSTSSSRQGVILQGGNPVGTSQFGTYANTSPVLDYQGTNGHAITITGPLQGWGIQGLQIVCSASSMNTTGVFVSSGQFGDSKNLRISKCEYGIYSTTVTALPGGVSIIDSIHNEWQNTFIEVPVPGVAITMTNAPTNPAADTDFNVFINTTIAFTAVGTSINNVTGIELQNCDDNYFLGVHMFGGNGSFTFPVVLDYTRSGGSWPSGNTFDGFDAGSINGSGFVNAGSPATGVAANYVDHLSTGNGDTYPTGVANVSTPIRFLNGAIALTTSTVSALPACTLGTKLSVAAVTDALSPSWNGTLTGGGTVPVLAICNGTSWTAH